MVKEASQEDSRRHERMDPAQLAQGMALAEEQICAHHLGVCHLDAFLRPEQRGGPGENVHRDPAA